MNWDDLRIIAAVRNEGSYARAGAQLRIDETTVARRLARLQRTLGVVLFEAIDGVRRPTVQCEMILAHVQDIARHVAAIGTVTKSAAGPVGRIRIASTNAIAEEVLAPRVGTLLFENPGLTLQFLTSSENVNFSRWKADLAIRLRKPEKGDFFISKLADIALYVIEPENIARLATRTVVCCYPDDFDFTPEYQYLKAQGLQEHARCVTDNVRIIRSLVLSRQAVGILPEYMCGELLQAPNLRVTQLTKRRSVWLLLQHHLKRNPATRIVVDWLRACFGNVA